MFNLCAFNLDLEQEGPLKESYRNWIAVFSELSIKGLVVMNAEDQRIMKINGNIFTI